jgi:hypothetical protein
VVVNKYVIFPIFIFVLTPSIVYSGNLISSATWVEDGGWKMSQQDQYPLGFSSNTISRIWDGTNIKLFGGKGELLTWVTYLNASQAGNANNVMVTLSSFTGTGSALGSGFSAVIVSSVNAWDYSQRPYSLYKYGYVQVIGMSEVGTAWDPTEYDQYQLPLRWRRPYTVNGNNDAVPNGGTTFLNRSDSNKFYPVPAVPMEEFTGPANSSFTVFASSSQAIGGEVYISTSLPAGTYTATETVWEGTSISTSIPVQLLVYNVTLPGTALLPVIGDLGYKDLDMRLTGQRNPANDFSDPYLTAHLRAAAFLHRHKVIAIGDPTTAGQDYPSIEYQKHIDGSAYKETYGLSPNTSPGYGQGDKLYVIGTYGGWVGATWSKTLTDGANGFCTNLSSWTAYCATNGLNCQLYTADDEASNAILAGEVNTLSTWASTAPTCANGSNRTPYLQTGQLPEVYSNAPNVNTVLTTSWLNAPTTTWTTLESLYQNSSTHTAGGYNSSIGVDSILDNQEDGLGSREPLWGAYKTNQAMWFLWETNYWQDSNNAGQAQNGYNANSNNDNNMYGISKTFGYDSFPTTDTVKGHTGFHFDNGAGVMLFNSTDTVSTGYSPVYSFNGVVGTWQLNMLTRGIQDTDLLKMANAINPSSTTAIMNNVVSDVMYLRQCFTLSDCTYSFGPRPWSQDRNAYEVAREALLQVIANFSLNQTTEQWRGAIKMQGVGSYR